MSRSNSLLRDLMKAVRWHRRLLAGVAAAAAVYFGLVALSPTPSPTVSVLAAARDLPGGAVPAAADVRVIQVPGSLVPSGVLRPGSELAKRILAAPVRSGETLTDARFLSPALFERLAPGVVAYPLRLDDPEIATLLRVGDQIDLYAAGGAADPVSAGSPGGGTPGQDTPRQDGAARRDDAARQNGAARQGGAVAMRSAELLAQRVRVLALPASRGGTGARQGALVVLGTTGEVAGRIAQATTNSRISIAFSAAPT